MFVLYWSCGNFTSGQGKVEQRSCWVLSRGRYKTTRWSDPARMDLWKAGSWIQCSYLCSSWQERHCGAYPEKSKRAGEGFEAQVWCGANEGDGKRRLWVDLIGLYCESFLSWGCTQGGFSLLSYETSDRRRRSDLRLLQRRFALDIRKNLLNENVVMHWNMLPREGESLKGAKKQYKKKID